MKNNLLLQSCFAVIMLISVSISVKVDHFKVFTPELFGYADAYFVGSHGVIVGPTSIFYASGKDMVQIAGQKIDNYGNIYPIPYVMKWNGQAFRGLIVFRGHERKFCGGLNSVPLNCMLKAGGTQ